MSVIVCQRGNRHRYAIPALFEEEGLLNALYTDSSCYSPMGRVATWFSNFGVKPAAFSALAARRPEGVSKERVFSSDACMCARFFPAKHSLASVYQKWGLRQADVIYSMYGEDPDFLEWAKGQGARIIVDVFVHPRTNRIVAEEELRFLGEADSSGIEREDAHSRRVFELADLLLCPSGWVADGVREFMPACESKVAVLPYGSSVQMGNIERKPRKGTILFAGRDPLRKGLHYLAEAACMLRQQGRQIDVRIAGISASEIGWIKHGSELNCLGSVPLSRMTEEYAQADLFVLPSLSEGQAGVVLEAMACGVPVVATRESGVDFEPGCGVTVPVGNAVALADSIANVLDDDAYRRQLAEGACRQSAMFSMEAWRSRLMHVVEGITQ